MGAEFTAIDGPLKGLIISLEEGEEWTIGRDPDLSGIVIEDPKASRLHLRIHQTDEGYVAENLSATNPLLINGEPLSHPIRLYDQDLLKIGDTVFEFQSESPEGIAFRFESPFEGEEFTEELESQSTEEPEEGERSEEEVAGEEIFEEPSAPLQEEESGQEPITSDELFEEADFPAMRVDLTPSTRFMIKVIAGPNTGAEFALDLERSYLLGTDAATCDIVFNDLSVSREHAQLRVDSEGRIQLEDLGSRNGVMIDKERIYGVKELTANTVVTLGTTAFLMIDREAPAETIAAPLFEIPSEPEKEEEEEEAELEEETINERPEPAPAAKATPKKSHFPSGVLLLALIIVGFGALVGYGMYTLFQTKEVKIVEKDQLVEIQEIMKQYPAVRFTFNKGSGKLFLTGHVKTGVEHNELLYELRELVFIKGIEDNVVNDEAVWQEMNILLSKHPQFKGVSMHSPKAGDFVISGYLETEKQSAQLLDYLNVNFNYLSLLQNRVVVEQSVIEEAESDLMQQGFGAVSVLFSNGDMQLTGYVSSTQLYEYEKLIAHFKRYPGVRNVRNFVVAVTPEQGVIDLNKKYPGKYRVTGFSTHGDININVVINGKILTRGDSINGYTITSIHPNTIFLEKEGLKYKIEYNK